MAIFRFAECFFPHPTMPLAYSDRRIRWTSSEKEPGGTSSLQVVLLSSLSLSMASIKDQCHSPLLSLSLSTVLTRGGLLARAVKLSSVGRELKSKTLRRDRASGFFGTRPGIGFRIGWICIMNGRGINQLIRGAVQLRVRVPNSLFMRSRLLGITNFIMRAAAQP